MRFFGSAAALAALLFTTAHAGDWPDWRGAGRTGISSETVVPWPAAGLKKLWEAQVGAGFSSVTVADGKLYTLGNAKGEDIVRCLDAVSGQEHWSAKYPCNPANNEMPGSRATPFAVDGRVFTASREAGLRAFNAKDGSLIWAKDLRKEYTAEPPHFGYASTPLVVDGKLIAQVGGKDVGAAAFDVATGKELWALKSNDTACYTSPVACKYDHAPCVAMLLGKALVVMEIAGGKERLRFPWRAFYDTHGADPLVLGDSIVIGSCYNVGAARIPLGIGPTPKPLWKNGQFQTHFGTASLLDGKLYGYCGMFNSPPQSLKCIDVSNGEELWSEDGKMGCWTLCGKNMLSITETGTLQLLELTPTGSKVLASAEVLDGECWIAPVVANGRLYVKNSAGRLVCYELPTKP